MSDIFREVEEDVRRERLEKIWKAYGGFAIVLAALVLAGVAGFEIWQRHEAAQRAKASDAYTAAQRISDPKAAATAFAELAKVTGGGYGLLAKLSQANTMYAAGQGAQAIGLYKEIAAADSGEVGAVARLRAAWGEASNAPRAQLETLLAPLNTPTSPWRQMALEVLAFSDYRAARIKPAAAEFHAIASDSQSPDALRSRAQAMAAFLDSGGGGDVGTVPPPSPKDDAAPAAAPAQ